MRKDKLYTSIRFGAEVLRNAVASFLSQVGKSAEMRLISLSVEHEDATWSYDTLEEFYADYRRHSGEAVLQLIVGGGPSQLLIKAFPRSTYVSVSAPARAEIESVFSGFEENISNYRLPPVEGALDEKPVVFIGHGRSPLWRDLKDHLQEKHHINVSAYETGARAGHSIRDILEQLVKESSFALLVLTAEDEQADGTMRARQNVVHEAGLFQGRLGFARALMLVEEGTESFSNVDGIQQIRFSRNNIKETFGEVLATLKREFISK